MAIPAIQRLDEMLSLCEAILAYELLAGLTAVRLREQRPGDGIQALVDYFTPMIAPLDQDRSTSPDVETLLNSFPIRHFASYWVSPFGGCQVASSAR